MGPPFYPIAGYSAAMPARTLSVAGGLLLALLAPAGAQAAPILEPLKPCYVTAGEANDPATQEGEPVVLRAAGFTPLARATLTIDGQTVEDDLQVDDQGRLVLPEFPAPFARRGTTRQSAVALIENGNPANAVSTTLTSAGLEVSVKPKVARPTQRIRFNGLGFTADKPVYAHYTFRGKQKARVRMSRGTGDCGAWSARRSQFPMRTPRLGRWIVQFDQSRRYVNGNTGRLRGVFVRLEFRIALEPR